MLTDDGKNLMSLVLAGKEKQVATHIVMGLNSITGHTTGNGLDCRYHTPYIVEEIPLTQSTIIDKYIVFAGQATIASKYVADNMGLVMIRPKGTSRVNKTLISVANTNSWSLHTHFQKLITPETTFGSDGLLALQYDSVDTAEYTGPVPLAGCGVDDIIAVPVFFAHSANTPVGDTFRITFNYTDVTPKTWVIEDTVIQTGAYYHFSTGDPSGGTIVPITVANKPSLTWLPNFETTSRAAVFQKPLSAGTGTGTALSLIRNYKNISSVEFEWIRSDTGKAYSSSDLLFGSMKLTPNYSADMSRVTVAYRKLLSSGNPVQLIKSKHQAFVNAEYRIYQMVEA